MNLGETKIQLVQKQVTLVFLLNQRIKVHTIDRKRKTAHNDEWQIRVIL